MEQHDCDSARDRNQLAAQLRQLLQQQLHLVLATHDGSAPYTSLMAFDASEDLVRLFFVTSRATRKFSNMAVNSRVSVLIDNRTNRSADFQSAVAVTALGEAKELQGEDRRGPLAHFLRRHPKLEPFCLAASTAFMEIKVSRYILVNQFEEVHLFDIL